MEKKYIFEKHNQKRHIRNRNIYRNNKKYNERVLQIENGTFTPVVFASNGAMAQ